MSLGLGFPPVLSSAVSEQQEDAGKIDGAILASQLPRAIARGWSSVHSSVNSQESL